ncbi:hypothetical protein EVAR_3678_1 [Eumeta japonica]|uniref:Uncharacterized protein n=1 Tax=Eumeta variegata TaxID=151549 RepID=A0A4C1SU08_EUMVA|nr:hypothetical protein EVAR_3678_1 [Eumeta japonica]
MVKELVTMNCRAGTAGPRGANLRSLIENIIFERIWCRVRYVLCLSTRPSYECIFFPPHRKNQRVQNAQPCAYLPAPTHCRDKLSENPLIRIEGLSFKLSTLARS